MAGYGPQGWGVGTEESEDGPQIENLTPAPGQLGSPSVPIQFDVYDPSGDLDEVLIWVKFDDVVGTFLMFDGSTFLDPFQAGSLLEVIVVGERLRFTVFHDGGWPSAFYLTPRAYDSSGNKLE